MNYKSPVRYKTLRVTIEKFRIKHEDLMQRVNSLLTDSSADFRLRHVCLIGSVELLATCARRRWWSRASCEHRSPSTDSLAFAACRRLHQAPRCIHVRICNHTCGRQNSTTFKKLWLNQTDNDGITNLEKLSGIWAFGLTAATGGRLPYQLGFERPGEKQVANA